MSDDDTWGKWLWHAKEKHIVKLLDGRECELIGVNRVPRSCKVKLYNRHYMCWVEDIALVSERSVSPPPSSPPASSLHASSPGTSAGPVIPPPPPKAPTWYLLDPWKIVHRLDEPWVQLHDPRAVAQSKSWLQVVRNPAALHPSFAGALPHPSR